MILDCRWQVLIVHNPMGLFVPVSRLNHLRRDIASQLEARLEQARHDRAARVSADVFLRTPTPKKEPFRWNVKVDRIGFLDGLHRGRLGGRR